MCAATTAGRALTLLAVALGLTLSESPARGQPATIAQDLFAHGRELRVHGDCSGAVALFRKALDVYPEGLGSLRNIAECQEAMGKYASARRAWLDIKRALLTNTSSRYEGWSQDADDAVGRLAQKTSTLGVELSVIGPQGAQAPSSGVELTVNGEPLSPSLRGTPVERDAGRYVVRAVGPDGRTRDEQVVDLASGDSKHVALRVVAAATEPTNQAVTVAPSTSPANGAETIWRSAGWISIGIGAASLVGAGISLTLYQSARDALDSRCPDYRTQPCDPSLQSIVDRGRTASTVFNVLTVAGLVGIVGGGSILIATRSGRNAQTAVVVGPTGLWATGAF